ncbi:hypothetical protein [Rhizobium sp. Root1203]|jgi:hypothetical protein|nr:hypothetical protein [Rhizobium sp. Root1203]
MTHILLNSALAILVSTAFILTAAAAWRSEARAMQKIPVKARDRQRPNG